MLEEVYAGLVVDPEDGFDVSIQFDTKNLTDAPGLFSPFSPQVLLFSHFFPPLLVNRKM